MWSFETIAALALQGALAVLTLVLYVLLLSVILPALVLKPRLESAKDEDGEAEKYVFANGRAIVWQPEGEDGRYIKQYSLSLSNGKKFVKVRFDGAVRSVCYEATALDSRDRILGTVSVREELSAQNGGVAKAVELPSETARVTVRPISVNGNPTGFARMVGVSRAGRIAYAAAVWACSVAEAYFLRHVIFAWGAFLGLQTSPERAWIHAVLVLAASAVALGAAYLILRLLRTERAREKGGRENTFRAVPKTVPSPRMAALIAAAAAFALAAVALIGA